MLREADKEVRAAAPGLTLDQIFESKVELQSNISEHLKTKMTERGILVEQVQLLDVRPDEEVMHAMNRVLIAKKHREAQEHTSEAERIKTVMEARADAERKELQGKGIAAMRKQIAEGYGLAVEELATKLPIDSKVLSEHLIRIMEIEATKELANSANAKIVFYPV